MLPRDVHRLQKLVCQKPSFALVREIEEREVTCPQTHDLGLGTPLLITISISFTWPTPVTSTLIKQNLSGSLFD
jgi:hypothetical protein